MSDHGRQAACAKKSDFGDRELRSTSRFTRLIFHHPSHASQSHPRGIFVPHGGSERIMSVDISWDTITKGPDGAELEARIKDFIHDKFQQVQLPRFIKSVQVHSFAFGSACPEVEIKDVSDPLSDFYEDDESSDDSHAEGEEAQSQAATQPALGDHPSLASQVRSPFSPTVTSSSSVAQELQSRFERGLAARTFDNDPFTEPLPRSSTPGIPGGTSNFSYFHHLPIGGLSGTHTPLAAVASGTPFSPMGWHHDFPHSLPPRLGPSQQVLRDPASHMNRPSDCQYSCHISRSRSNVQPIFSGATAVMNTRQWRQSVMILQATCVQKALPLSGFTRVSLRIYRLLHEFSTRATYE